MYPFFGNNLFQTSRPRYSPAVRVPVQNVAQQRPSATNGAVPKMVSIPVHYVGSDTTRAVAAVKIQKVVRGFLVRKSMKKIASTRRDVDEVERRLSQKETVDLIRSNERERLKVIETLMALLFKLDCIRGIDAGVRECRRAVIKKAIALQEKVDAIVASATDEAQDLASKDPVVEEAAAVPSDAIVDSTAAVNETPALASKNQMEEKGVANDPTDATVDSATADDKCKDLASKDQMKEEGSDDVPCDEALECSSALQSDSCVDQTEGKAPEFETSVDATSPDKIVEKPVEPEGVDELEKSQLEVELGIEDLIDNCEKMEMTAGGTMEEEEPDCVVKEIVDSCDRSPPSSESLTENVNPVNTYEQSTYPENRNDEEHEEVISKESQEKLMSGVWKECLTDAEEKEEYKRNRELLEKMVEDNKKLMLLMMQLYDKNETQTQMLNSLTRRVEQLEKAFLCDRLRKKKRSNAANM